MRLHENLGNSWHNLGETYRGADRNVESVLAYLRASRIYDELHHRDPEIDDYKRLRDKSFRNATAVAVRLARRTMETFSTKYRATISWRD